MSAAMTGHVPVLMNEVVDALQPRDGGRYVDGTFGGGGYTTAILDRAECEVIAIDRDPDAISAGEALGAKGALKVALDDEAFDPAGYLSASARTVPLEPDGRFTMPGEFAQVLGADDGVMLVGKGDKFQLWNPKRWQARRDADRAKMEAFVRGLSGGDA